jgi:hypothetical protein
MILRSTGEKTPGQAAGQAAAHPPAVNGVCFTDVDGEELHVCMVLRKQLLDTHGAFDIRRSGKAAKDQRHRAFPAESGKGD